MALWGSNKKYMSWILNFSSNQMVNCIYKGDMQSSVVVPHAPPPHSSDSSEPRTTANTAWHLQQTGPAPRTLHKRTCSASQEPSEVILLLSLFYRWGNWVTEKELMKEKKSSRVRKHSPAMVKSKLLVPVAESWRRKVDRAAGRSGARN